MIRTLRAYYLSRLLREKILLAGLAFCVAIFWLSSFAGRADAFWDDARQTTIGLAEQARWLSNRDAILAAASKGAARLDASSTLDSTRLLAEVSAMARDAGLSNVVSGDSRDESSGQFSLHTIEFTIAKADWGSLKSFYLALQARSPYIGIDQFAVQADRANPNLLTATFRLSSVEIAH